MSEDLYAAIRESRKRITAREIRADGYKGKKKWMIIHQVHGVLQIFAPNVAAAIYAAGNFWGVSPKKAEFHQGCSVREM